MKPSTYANLPERFFARVAPTPVAEPRIIQINRPLAGELNFNTEGLETARLSALFSGNELAPATTPIAMAYAGHQFGHFVPQLGDGRAILLGEMADRAGRRYDIQLKGCGRTPFSRNGDGRAALGPVLREYVVSEAMHALGIRTTRSLAAVTSGENVRREQLLPGAILTRVAESLVRVGSFEYFAPRGDLEGVKILADYVIDRLFAPLSKDEQRYVALLREVVSRQASLVAAWMCVGFIHGVMNTDNMAISGETIDFGPCAFLDAYDPAAVFSSIDANGRYAYANQPHAAVWNLARFAECLLPILDAESGRALDLAQQALASFEANFVAEWQRGMRRKLGLISEETEDRELIDDLLGAMHRHQADFTLTFRRLCDVPTGQPLVHAPGSFETTAEYREWTKRWGARSARENQTPAARARNMRLANPTYIPRNHRIEQMIAAAVQGDLEPFEQLSTLLREPYREHSGFDAYSDPPRPEERVLQTFCGT